MDRKTLWAAVAALLVATAAVYLPSIDGEFQYDDQEIAKTTWVREGSRFLGLDAWRTVERPLTGATFAANHAMAGFKPRVWHVTNLAVHLVAVLLVWRLARALLARARLRPGGAPRAEVHPREEARAGRQRRKGPASAAESAAPVPNPVPEWVALAAAALFALHPLHTEAVSYISQRSEALASCFYVGALLALLAWDRRDPALPPGAPKVLGELVALAVAGTLHLLGLMAKPIAATMPAAWLLAALVLPPAAELGRAWWWRILRRLPLALPLFWLSYRAAQAGVQGAKGSGHAGFDLGFVTPLQYFASQLRALPTYLRLVFAPVGQNADWWFPFSRSLREGAVLAGAALLLALTLGALVAAGRFARREGDGAAAVRVAAFGVLFFLGLLAPTALVPLRDPFVEHRLYLPSFGIVLGATAVGAVAVRRLAPARAALVPGAVLLAALVALGAATAVRNKVWRSALALWSDASKKAPQKPRIWVNLGTALHFAGRFEEAVVAYDRALALGFDPTVPLELVVRNTALALVRLQRYEEARQRLVRYLEKVPRDAGTIVILALVEVDTGRLDEAEKSARLALSLEPRQSRPFQILGQVQEKRGDLDGAYAHFLTAARNDPADPLPVYSMGRIEEKRGRVREACALYARATDALARSSAARTAAQAYRRLCAGSQASR
jgi:tetratricopeptide (TPR) repeat protein